MNTLEGKRRVLGDDHGDNCKSSRRWLECITDNVGINILDRLILVAYGGYANRLGDAHESTRRMVEVLGMLYTDTGQLGKAEQWRAKLRTN